MGKFNVLSCVFFGKDNPVFCRILGQKTSVFLAEHGGFMLKSTLKKGKIKYKGFFPLNHKHQLPLQKSGV